MKPTKDESRARVHAVKAYGEVEFHFKPQHQVQVNGQLHEPISLLKRKEDPLTTDQEAGWVPEPVWKFKESENLAHARNLTTIP